MQYPEILQPRRLWRRSEILIRDCPVPAQSGLYGWYFREIPPLVPTDGCRTAAGATLLYVGISPKRPPANGRPPSRQHLRQRVRYHLRGNAEGSTLRFTLGCLLSERLGIQLRRVGGGSRRTFAEGERRLDEWLDANALVAFLPHPEPWTAEEEVIAAESLPLNLEGNRHHPFHARLTEIRRSCRHCADAAPIWRRPEAS